MKAGPTSVDCQAFTTSASVFLLRPADLRKLIVYLLRTLQIVVITSLDLLVLTKFHSSIRIELADL